MKSVDVARAFRDSTVDSFDGYLGTHGFRKTKNDADENGFFSYIPKW